MISKSWKSKAERERRIFIAWLVGSIVMPFSAYPFISAQLRFSDLDIPIVLFLGLCWGLCSFLLSTYLRRLWSR